MQTRLLSPAAVTAGLAALALVWAPLALQALEAGELATLGLTFSRDAAGANAFSKLSRYEAGIERALYRALHELQRLQAARQAGGGAPPMAVDVTIDVESDA